VICARCGIDMDEVGVDNVSPVCGVPICEECAAEMTPKDWERLRAWVEDDE